MLDLDVIRNLDAVSLIRWCQLVDHVLMVMAQLVAFTKSFDRSRLIAIHSVRHNQYDILRFCTHRVNSGACNLSHNLCENCPLKTFMM